MATTIKKVLSNPLFTCSIIASFLGLIIFQLPEMLETPLILRSVEYYPSALQFTVFPIYIGGFILVLPIAAALPSTYYFIDSIRSKYWRYEIFRVGEQRFLLQKASSAMVTGGIAVAVGFLLHAIVCYTFFLPSNPSLYESHVLEFGGSIYDGLYSIMGGIPMLGYLFIAIMFSSSIWALIGIAIAVWIPDVLIAITSPLIIYYVWLWSGIRSIWFFVEVSPTALFNDGLTVSKLLTSIVQHIVVIGVGYYVFRKGIQRRLRDGE